MKGSLKYLFVLVISFSFFIPGVSALDEETATLFTADTPHTVDTEYFTYDSVYYRDGYIIFGSIKNLDKTKKPVSITLGLFDKNEKNIGVINYCSNKDYDSEYADTELMSMDATGYRIKVSDKYLSKGKSGDDIYYLSVLDDNEYCTVGGYLNYEGMTLDQIFKDTKKEASSFFFDFSDSLSMIVLVILAICLFCYIINGIILNSLHRRMYERGTALAWIPICNSYLCVKLSFGKPVAIGYLFLIVISLFLPQSMMLVVSSISSVFMVICFIVVIIKLVTKNYFLFTKEEQFNPMKKSNDFFRQDRFDMKQRDQMRDEVLHNSEMLHYQNDSSQNLSDVDSSISMGGAKKTLDDDLVFPPTNSELYGINSNGDSDTFSSVDSMNQGQNGNSDAFSNVDSMNQGQNNNINEDNGSDLQSFYK